MPRNPLNPADFPPIEESRKTAATHSALALDAREFRRELRKNMSPPEVALWTQLRGKQMNGLRFRRQHPLGPYIADFFCTELGLVVEVDGSQHGTQTQHDAIRDRWMIDRGLTVVRIPARRLGTDMNGVLELIAQTDKTIRAKHSPS